MILYISSIRVNHYFRKIWCIRSLHLPFLLSGHLLILRCCWSNLVCRVIQSCQVNSLKTNIVNQLETWKNDALNLFTFKLSMFMSERKTILFSHMGIVYSFKINYCYRISRKRFKRKQHLQLDMFIQVNKFRLLF